MKMLDSAQHLIEKVGHAFVIQVHLNHLAEICIHQLHDEVDVGKLRNRFLWREGIEQTYDL